jgi:hypothetical protein
MLVVELRLLSSVSAQDWATVQLVRLPNGRSRSCFRYALWAASISTANGEFAAARPAAAITIRVRRRALASGL